jgi:type IV pilus assembly protein PilV
MRARRTVSGARVATGTRRVTSDASPRCGSRSHAAGAFLLEALVVVVLCAIGMIGLIGLQSSTVRHAVEAEDTVRAALLASELGMRMWTAGTVALPQADLAAWSDRVADTRAGGLPDGRGEVTVQGERARIVVSWQPPQNADGTRRRYVTDVLLP